MIEQRNFAEVFEALYETEEHERRWNRVAHALSALLKSTTVRLSAMHRDSGETLLDALTLDWPSSVLHEYDACYRKDDPRMRAAMARVGTTLTCTEVVAPDEFERTALCDFLDRPDVDTRWGILQVAETHDGFHLLVGACRGRATGPFLAADKAAFDAVSRHVFHALELETRLLSLARDKRALSDSLDVNPTPTIILTADLHVLHMNAPAERLVCAETGLRLRNGRLTAARSRDQRLLEGIVGRANAMRDGQDGGAEATVLHALDGSPVLARAYPLPRASYLNAGACADQCALLFTTGERRVDRGLDAVLESFGLTAAEQKLVRRLLQGSDLAHAARAFGISIETARSQIKSARSKVGARRQSDLLRLLSQYI